MNTSLFIWAVLMIIGVSDAKAHRIPNKLLILLILMLCLSTLLNSPNETLWSEFLNKSMAFLIAFTFGLALYLIRVMAPGDVKFIAVLGFFLGSSELVNYLYYVSLITVFVGVMYWLLNRLNPVSEVSRSSGAKEQECHTSVAGLAITMQIGIQDLKRKVVSGNELSYMPFAPILVMGLALHQYYS